MRYLILLFAISFQLFSQTQLTIIKVDGSVIKAELSDFNASFVTIKIENNNIDIPFGDVISIASNDDEKLKNMLIIYPRWQAKYKYNEEQTILKIQQQAIFQEKPINKKLINEYLKSSQTNFTWSFVGPLIISSAGIIGMSAAILSGADPVSAATTSAVIGTVSSIGSISVFIYTYTKGHSKLNDARNLVGN